MAIQDLLITICLGCLLAALAPAVLFHHQRSLEFLFPVRGRWLPPLLWATSVLSFLAVLVLMSSGTPR